MDKVLGPAYTGDPGVPHVDKDIFSNIFLGSVAFALYAAVDPYPWQHATQFKYVCVSLSPWGARHAGQERS